MLHFNVVLSLCPPKLLLLYTSASSCFPHFVLSYPPFALSCRLFIFQTLRTTIPPLIWRSVPAYFRSSASLFYFFSCICCSVCPSLSFSVHRLHRLVVHLFTSCSEPPSFRSSAAMSLRFFISCPIVSLLKHVSVSTFSVFLSHRLSVSSPSFFAVPMNYKLLQFWAKGITFSCLNKLFYLCIIVARSHNDNIMVTYWAFRALRALFLYTGESHWLERCVRQSNLSVKHVCDRILLTGVENGVTLRVGRYATRLLTRLTDLCYYTVHKWCISSDAARKSVCDRCTDVVLDKQINSKHWFTIAEEVGITKLVYQIIKLLIRVLTVRLPNISTISIITCTFSKDKNI